jgi:hypothetical protein
MRLLVRSAALLALLSSVSTAQEAKKKYKLLVCTQSAGFRHGPVTRKAPTELAPCEVALTEIGKESGLYETECTQDASVITPEKLKDVDLVFFYTTGNLPISETNFAEFESWLRSGKAFVAAHSATDTFHKFKPYYSLINGTFAGHPWGAGTTVTISNHEPDHVVAKMWGEEFQIKDEIYQYRNFDPGAVRVLYSLNMGKTKPQMPYHVPICWVREVGKGRMFYTNLGHNAETWKNPKFREHLLTGIRWSLGLEKSPAEPNPEVSAREQVKAFLHVTAEEAAPSEGGSDKRIQQYLDGEKKDAQLTPRLLKEIEGFRAIDRKKDPDRWKSEAARIVALIGKP